MSEQPSSLPGTDNSSLWTTPAAGVGVSLDQARVDPSVSADKLRKALDGTKGRAAAFSGRVSEEILRSSF